MTKNGNVFIRFLYSFSIYIVASFIYLAVNSYFKDTVISYTISTAITILILYSMFRNKIKKDIINFKDDFKNNLPHIIVVPAILIGLEIIVSLILSKLGIYSSNQLAGEDILKNSNFLIIFYTAILAPVFEEMVFRLPYHYSTSNKVLTYIVYSVVFALTHIMTVDNLLSLIYIIPYLLLSFGIGYNFYKTDNIFMSTLVHIINNSIAVMLILL
jgi:sodium transport system permease protein